MAFAQKNLSCVGVGGDNSIFLYTTTDSLATVETDDYFLAAYAQLKVGDTIIAYVASGGTPIKMVYTVTASASTGVDLGRAGLVYLQGVIDDVSTGASFWTPPSPVNGTIIAISSVINGTIATANAALTFEIGGTAITDGGITIAYSGSAAGDVDTAAPTALNTITAGVPIECITNGASTNTIKAELIFTIVPN